MNIQNLSQLSRIAVTPEEERKYEREITAVLSYVDRIQEAVGTDSILHDDADLSVRNVMRPDTDPHDRALYTDAILHNAPDTNEGYVTVRKIL